MTRQVYIGKLQKDNPNITKILQSGIIMAKKLFFQANDIQDYEVLSIKNDAVFLINKIPMICKFDNIEFKNKNKYTGFYKILNLEIYYYFNSITNEESIDVKGISDDKLEPHKNYFLQFLKDLFYTIQCNGIDIALRLLKDFYIQYVSLSLNSNYYRQFNSSGIFHFMIHTSMNTGFAIESINENEKHALDISCNLKILTELQKILISMYFDKYR